MRILIVKLSSLGDCIHALPTVHILKSALNADIDWLIHPVFAPLIRCCPDVDKVIEFPRRQLFRQLPRILKNVRCQSYDMVIDLQGLLKSASAARLAKTKRRLGPSFNREGARFFYHEHPPRKPHEIRHAVDQIMDVLDLLNIPRQKAQFPLSLPPCPLPQTSPPHIVMAPCSRWPSKNWPPDRYALAGTRLIEQTGGSISLIGTASDRATCESIAASMPALSVRNIAGQTTMVEMASILQTAQLVITNDSGPMHLAAALQRPTLAIFGPTDPRRTGPYSGIFKVLQHDISCQYCRKRKCDRPATSCMESVTVTKVVTAAQDLLNLNQQG